MGWLGRVAPAIGVALLSCDGPSTDPVAVVGDRRIERAEFEVLAERLLAGPMRDVERVDDGVRRQILDAVVGKYLLLMEAEKLGLEQPQRAELVARESLLITRALYERCVFREREVEEAELEALFHGAGFDRETRFRHVLCASAGQAHSVIAELMAGRAIDELAQERSIHRASARRGGDMGWVPMGDMLPQVGAALDSLEVGQIRMAPVESRYGFHVLQVTARRPAPFERHRNRVRQLFITRQHEEQVAAYLDSLSRARAVECVPADRVLSLPDSPDGVLCTWTGRSLRAGQYRAGLEALREPVPEDPEQRQASVERVARAHLAVEEGRRLGVDTVATVVDGLRRYREDLLSRRIEAQVTKGVAVTEAQIRSFYQDHPELYGARPMAEIREILVSDQDTALALRQRLDAGADMVPLVVRYSERETTASLQGWMRVVLRDNPLLGPLAPAALDGEPGHAYGPLAVPGGYSVFRVERKGQLPPRPLERARPAIEAVLQVKSRNLAMDEYLDQLRARHARRVQTFPEVLARTLVGRVPGRDTAADTTSAAAPLLWEN